MFDLVRHVFGDRRASAAMSTFTPPETATTTEQNMNKPTKKNAKRLYAVNEVSTGKTYLVEAFSQASARNHAARNAFAVSIPTNIEAFKLAQAGVKIEETDSPEQLDILEDGLTP